MLIRILSVANACLSYPRCKRGQLGGKDVAKDYRVSGYPTMYLIDKNGKIIFTQVGYGKGKESTIEEIILKNL